SGRHCGIKDNGDMDLAYIYVPHSVGSAIVQSQNAIRSATLDHNDHVFKQGPVKLMIINSGNANSVTGSVGNRHVQQTIQAAAKHFKCEPSAIAVASTGIIGVPLPIDKILDGIALFDTTQINVDACANAIRTTDLVSKTATRTIQIHGQPISFLGITKGSGMIAPNMATTLGFIVTDLTMSSDICQQVLVKAIDASYNMLSVDTDSSTNDMVSLQSSGAIDLPLAPPDVVAVEHALTELCIDLAKQIARDGEGATHFIEVNVSGASSKQDAKRVAKLIVESPLVKTAIAGNDPNWGRIMMAMGKDPSVTMDESCISININGCGIFSKWQATLLTRDEIKAAMSPSDVIMNVVIGHGQYMATAWGCDLTHGYIDINTQYN
ncbi:MAG: bifunctional glutamate N-acetyltransferase/amino-acid acetyltransferase ArgJ, partial [Candidatus Marinamargulisbacteria bacterium]